MPFKEGPEVSERPTHHCNVYILMVFSLQSSQGCQRTLELFVILDILRNYCAPPLVMMQLSTKLGLQSMVNLIGLN